MVGALAAPSIVTAASRKIRIGFISPLSGPRASFGTSDQWMVEAIRKQLHGGLTSGGANHEVEIIIKDNQSNMNRSISAGNELLLRDQVDVLLINDGDAAVALGEIARYSRRPNHEHDAALAGMDVPTRLEPGTGFSMDVPFLLGCR